MITFLEEAMDWHDGLEAITQMIFERGAYDDVAHQAMYIVRRGQEIEGNLLAMIEEAPDGQPNTSEAEVDNTQTNSTTYQEHISNVVAEEHFKEDEPEEIPIMKGTTDLLDTVIESAPKPRLTGKKGKAFRLWKDKGAGPSRIVEECDISLEKAAKWVREFGEMQK